MAKATVNDKTQYHHSALIDLVLDRYPGASRKDFPESVKAALNLDDSDDLPRFDFRPDAFHIDHESQTIALFEVEITHGVDDPKMQKLSWLWFCLDCIYWDCVLIIVDQRGVERQIDLCDQYWRSVQQGLPHPIATGVGE
jgi:hypothetical protein